MAIGVPHSSAAHGVVQAHAAEGAEGVGVVRPGAHAAVAAAGRQQLAAVWLRGQAEHVPGLPALRDAAPCDQRQQQPVSRSLTHTSSSHLGLTTCLTAIGSSQHHRAIRDIL